MSLGPDPVTDRVRAVEHAEERSRRQIEKNQVRAGEHSAGPSQKVAPAKKAAPKKKTIQPELKERRERAAEVMLQLGVAPVQLVQREASLPSVRSISHSQRQNPER